MLSGLLQCCCLIERDLAGVTEPGKGLSIYVLLYRASPLWCAWTRKQQRDVPVDAGFLCDTVVVLGDRIKGTHRRLGYLEEAIILQCEDVKSVIKFTINRFADPNSRAV
jgi:hypothetical protein